MANFGTVIWATGDLITQSKMSQMVNNVVFSMERPQNVFNERGLLDLLSYNTTDLGIGTGTMQIRIDDVTVASETFVNGTSNGLTLSGGYQHISKPGSAGGINIRNIDVSLYSKSASHKLSIRFVGPSSTTIGETVLDQYFYFDEYTTNISLFGRFEMYYNASFAKWFSRSYDVSVWTQGQTWSDFA